MRKQVFISAILFGIFLASFAEAKLANFSQVDAGIFRGAQPTAEEDFEELKSHHIKTIISLQDFLPHVSQVRKGAEDHGFQFLSYPISALTPKVSQETVEKVLDAMRNPDLQPVYLHCLLGKDRTGLVVGLYRVHVQHRSSEEAFQEMEDKGFKPHLLLAMKHFFWEHTAPGALHLFDFSGRSGGSQIQDPTQ